MKKYDHWVCWKSKQRENGKSTKVPINPFNGRYAKTNDPTTWGSFEDAESCYRSNGFDGVGFVFSNRDDLVGIDLDNCLDPESGKTDPHADKIIEKMQSYTEVSPSGRGVHIIVKGKLPGPGRKTDQIEIYNEKRFFTITGHRVGR